MTFGLLSPDSGVSKHSSERCREFSKAHRMHSMSWRAQHPNLVRDRGEAYRGESQTLAA